MDFLCFYVCCVLRGFDTGDFDSSGALGSVSFRCNNSRCQVPFQSLPSPLASPTFGIPPDHGECDAETIGLEQVEPGRVGVDRPVGIDDRAIERLPFEPFGLFKATLEGPPVGRGRDHDRRRRFGPLFSGRRPGLL